jgi:hypothetical protein
MVIWARWGILGLLIPAVFISVAISAMKPSQAADRQPVKEAKVAEEAEDPPPAENLEELKAAERKRAAERDKATKRAEGSGYLIGALVSAAVLWPLGRWMNKSESRTLVDQQSGQVVEAQVGGGHTLFFVPLEYWSFIWAAIGLFKFISRG